MEKTARRPSADPSQERLRQNKAAWNKEVSAFINDLIHFKKMMNGWPSKFFKERARITQPIPADPATIIGSLAGDFQEIANRGNSLIQEQIEYAKNRRQKQPKTPTPEAGAPPAPTAPSAPEAPEAPKPDLTQQLNKGIAASAEEHEIVKLASDFELKYELEVMASNPFSRFITRLFNPKFGFGEGARIRRLRMTMLDNCVRAYKDLKKLHKEIIKSSTNSIVNSHHMMTLIWNYWNSVNKLFSTYKAIRPGEIADDGGEIDDPDLKKEKLLEQGRDPEEGLEKAETPIIDGAGLQRATSLIILLKDYRSASASFPLIKSPAFHELNSIVESIMAAPQNKKTETILRSNINDVYHKAIGEVNAELGTQGSSFKEIAATKNKEPATKQAQRQFGKIRHEMLPGATSGQRLEIYNLIVQLKRDLDQVMNLLESGFDQEQLTTAMAQVNKEMITLRTTIRSLYFTEKPVQKGKGTGWSDFF